MRRMGRSTVHDSMNIIHMYSTYLTQTQKLSYRYTSGANRRLLIVNFAPELLYEKFLQVQQIGFVTLGPYAMHRGGCLELYYCIIVTWRSGAGGIQGLSARSIGFLQCFDTVGLVI